MKGENKSTHMKQGKNRRMKIYILNFTRSADTILGLFYYENMGLTNKGNNLMA